VFADESGGFNGYICGGVAKFGNGCQFAYDELEAISDFVTGVRFAAGAAAHDVVAIDVDALLTGASGAVLFCPKGTSEFLAKGDSEGVVRKAEVRVLSREGHEGLCHARVSQGGDAHLDVWWGCVEENLEVAVVGVRADASGQSFW